MKNIKYILFCLPVFFFSWSCTTDAPVLDTEQFVPPSVQEIVMYEVNLRVFSDTYDFDGVTAGLDHMASLGVNTIWLMPVFPVGQLNSVGQLGSPYAVADYQAVNPEFGDMQDFQELVDAAHERGIAVILDWVANHTAWDNPWISNTSWYTQDAAGNIVSPPGTGWNDVADLNFDNAAMRRAMIDALSFWVTNTGIDGFRCDAADYVPFDFWQQAIDSLHRRHGEGLILLAEGARADHFAAGFQMNYGWSFYGSLQQVFNQNAAVATLWSTHNAEYSPMPPGTRRLRFTTNHDESAWDAPPPVLFGGQDAALSAFVFSTFLGGVPLIYNGQEVGKTTTTPFFSRGTINWFDNPDVLATYRKLMQIYTSEPAARAAEIRWVDTGFHIATFVKEADNVQIMYIVNPRNATVGATPLPEDLEGQWVDMMTGASMTIAGSLAPAPHSFYILKRTL